MKNFFVFSLLFFCLSTHAQNDCDEVNSYLVIAYSHVKESYESNNISHLKYYADRSLKTFKLAKNIMGNCNCVKALILANKSIDLLAKVDPAETYEDGRFFVKRARDLSKECVIEIDKCSVATSSPTITENTDIDDLSDLQKEQMQLKQQQDALKLKEQEIKAKLAEQNEKALILKKKQLIHSYESAITSNIKTYNETLHLCNCNNHNELIAHVASEDQLESQSLDAIKSYFNQTIKTLASDYVAQLDLCEEN